MLDLLQTSEHQNSLWITSVDQKDLNMSENFLKNLSEAHFLNRMYAITGSESKQLVQIERLNLKPQFVFHCYIQNDGNLSEIDKELQKEWMLENDNLNNRKDLSGVHLKIGFISMPNFIECHNNVSIT